MPSLEFKGKAIIYAHHIETPIRPLIPNPDRSVGPTGMDGNLIIHGDNLHALKALLPQYAGKVKCVYIDPPYNTGNKDWAYNDNVDSPMMREWLGKTVDREDLERHDKWLCMMWPRLNLLKELLSDDGVIFISIDDNEQHYLRMLMDEIFGEGNFISTVIWHKMDSPKNTTRHISEDHESLHIYAKDSDTWRPNLLPRDDKMLARYQNPDNDARGPWLLSDLAARNRYSRGRYPITTPSGNVIEGPPAGSYWRISKEKFDELEADNRIWWGQTGNNRPGIKRFLSEVQEGVVPRTLWAWKEVGSTRHSKQELSTVMSAPTSSDLFITPKPTALINRILQIATNPDSIILDSFAGSGTTAQAVLALNKEDGGNRKFILVECEDYADTITAERVRRVIKGVPKARDASLREGLGGSFTYFTMGDPIDNEGMLTGEKLPDYRTFAEFLLYIGHVISVEETSLDLKNEDGLFFSRDAIDYYLLYRPDINWLRGNEGVLKEDQAKRIGAANAQNGRKAYVWAVDKVLTQRELSALGIDFCQIPYEMFNAG